MPLLVFRLGDECFGIRTRCLAEVFHLPRLMSPPALPPAVLGFADVGGTAVAVLRLDRLLGLREEPPHLYTPVLLLRHRSPPLALAVHGVVTTLVAEEDQRVPVEPGSSFNGCLEAEVASPLGTVHLLAESRLLLVEERERLAAFHDRAQERLLELRGVEP
jgi:chemotaxis signal transduction protein